MEPRMEMTKLKKLKVETCIFPKCNKEVYDDKSVFCGHHKRVAEDIKKKAGTGLLAAGTSMLVVKIKDVIKKSD